MKLFYSIADLPICIETPCSLEISKESYPFLISEGTDCVERIELIPMKDLPPIEKAGIRHQDRHYTGTDAQEAIYIRSGPGEPPYAMLAYNEEHQVRLMYLRDSKDMVLESRYLMNMIGLEQLLLRYDGLILHSSLVRWQGKGILFSAPSGTGKSTQASLWEKHMGAEILNGDRAGIRYVDGRWMAYGLPYAGSSRIYCIVVKINCSITPYNVDDWDGIFAFAKQEGLLVQASSYMFPPLRRDTAMVGKNDRLTAEEAAYQSARIISLLNGDDYFLQQMENRATLSLSGDSVEDCPELPVEGECIRCRAGECIFWVTWDGRILPCGMFPGDDAENVFETKFTDAWCRIKEAVATIRMPPKCSKCQMRDQCKACAAMALTETGRFDQVPEYRCQMMHAFDDASKLLEHQILETRRR